MTELICIVCPKGCHLKVDEEKDFAVTGNGCPRGAEYGKKELTNPTRVITSTVRVEGGAIRRARLVDEGPAAREGEAELLSLPLLFR